MTQEDKIKNQYITDSIYVDQIVEKQDKNVITRNEISAVKGLYVEEKIRRDGQKKNICEYMWQTVIIWADVNEENVRYQVM